MVVHNPISWKKIPVAFGIGGEFFFPLEIPMMESEEEKIPVGFLCSLL